MIIPANHTALSVKDLAIGYKNTPVVSKLNFNVKQGKLMGIVGVNGIGKSTLLRTVAQIQPQLSGSIQIQGKALETLNAKTLAATVSIVLTDTIASKNLTVMEIVALGRQPYTNWIGTLSKTDTQKVAAVIQRLELSDLKYKKCYQLSDGQMQRVMIARALAQDTPLMLLDEPTTHLDLYHKVKILKLLKTIATETNTSILFTSHEIEMVLQICDTMLLLDGKNNTYGQPDQLIKQHAFDHLFPADTLAFDASTGTFRIKN